MLKPYAFTNAKNCSKFPPICAGAQVSGIMATRQLRFIRTAQQAGFTLSEIAELLALDKGRDRRRVREMARARIAALDEDIAGLQSAKKSLSSLAHICAHGDDGPCPIIEAFSS